MTIRFATEADCPLILDFVQALAAYEKMSDQVIATEELLHEWIFEKKKAEVLLLSEDQKEVGFALFFHNFSTFLGRAGIYLEDLFVLPEYRGKGYGAQLMEWALNRFNELGLHDVDVKVADGNDAISLYEKYGFQMNAHILRLSRSL